MFLRSRVLTPRFFSILLLFHAVGTALALPSVGWKWLIFPALAAGVFPVLLERLPGRHPYLKLWFFGTLFWVYLVHFVRFPHWINYGLWFLLAGYMGAGLPIFVGISRTLIYERLPKWGCRIFGKRVSEPSIWGGCFPCASALLVIPVIWLASDLIRGFPFAGAIIGTAADVFYRDPLFIQIADIAGQRGTAAFLVFLSTAFILALKPILEKLLFLGSVSADGNESVPFGVPNRFAMDRTVCIWGTSAFLAGLMFLVGYGYWRLGEPNPNVPMGNFALLQGSVKAELTVTPELAQKTDAAYSALLQKVHAMQNGHASQSEKMTGSGTGTAEGEKRLDLVVYPESIYRFPILFAEKNARMPAGLLTEDGMPFPEDGFQEKVERSALESQEYFLDFTEHAVQAPLLAGCSISFYREDGTKHFNSAIFARPGDQELDPERIYHKMGLVPFGEYIPLMRTLRTWFPALEKWMPIYSLDAGTHPVAIPIPVSSAGQVSPAAGLDAESDAESDADGKTETLNALCSICFETTLSQMTRKQIAELRGKGTEADLILTLANNGWFGLSHESELLLACGVLRAVENRKPLLMASNYGITASIDGNGRILGEIETGKEDVLFAQVQKDPRRSFFTEWGWLFFWFPLAAAVLGIPVRKRKNGEKRDPSGVLVEI